MRPSTCLSRPSRTTLPTALPTPRPPPPLPLPPLPSGTPATPPPASSAPPSTRQYPTTTLGCALPNQATTYLFMSGNCSLFRRLIFRGFARFSYPAPPPLAALETWQTAHLEIRTIYLELCRL